MRLFHLVYHPNGSMCQVPCPVDGVPLDQSAESRYWCPICQRHVSKDEEHVEEIAQWTAPRSSDAYQV